MTPQAARATTGEWILDRASVRAVDRAAVEAYGIPGVVLMENAARGLLAEALRMLRGTERPSALIVCGAGNNGGDGWALGRHLHNHGCDVTMAPLEEPRPGSDAAINSEVCRRMKLRETPAPRGRARTGAALVVDAIFGTGLDRPVSGAAAEAIEWINGCGRPVLAVDVPSGLDCDTGAVLGIAVRARRTVTFVARKPAMALPAVRRYTGTVVVADIGAPAELLAKLGRRG
jgi:NAD(P)H-hydrate epimerase